ncbi:MAG TPA: hypothetical protein VNY73_03365, partial [Bacteroidia bacterium]|jgi:hypothetical protein|nr:hypothetical protein [Bacteroidia bacterium]
MKNLFPVPGMEGETFKDISLHVTDTMYGVYLFDIRINKVTMAAKCASVTRLMIFFIAVSFAQW